MKPFHEIERALDRLEDSLDCDHEPDCPMTYNHKGAYVVQDNCACWVGEMLSDLWEAVQWGEEKLRGARR